MKFSELNLSAQTLKGLNKCNFIEMTPIQSQSLIHSLQGKDVIGSAKTGSGKTLALIIPILECLLRNNWTKFDGLGALVICPTRELSYQIFGVLNDVGCFHNFSVALLIGGTDVEYEKKRLGTMNIIICTPGRLLQHMDENENFNCDHLQILVIDEADRILDLGFKKQMDSIIENLSKDRQTLLFSATQTKKVEDLSRVSLKHPVDVSINEKDDKATPDQLDQARYLTESFCHLRPGVSLMGLWGSMSQTKRLDVFHKFDKNTKGAAMIATDVASRGLDFRNVDWVFQLDCPADVNDYIHRVGRTARFENKGKATLVLTPSQEEPFLDLLLKKNVPIKKFNIKEQDLVDIRLKLSNNMVIFPQLKDFAKKSIVAYARAIYFMKLKKIFDVKAINFEKLANSYGLPIMPRIRFLKRQGLIGKDKLHDFVPKPEKMNENNCEEIILSEEKLLGDDTFNMETDNRNQINNTNNNEKNLFNNNNETDITNDDEDKDEFLKISRRDVFNTLKSATIEDEIEERILRKNCRLTKQQFAKKIIKRGIKLSKHIQFNNDDNDE